MNVLVLTDNISQYNAFRKIVQRMPSEGVSFEYRHSGKSSPVSKHPDFTGIDASCNVKEEYSKIIQHYGLVISMHCTQIFPAALVKAVRCINIHPGYNPVNRGWYPQVFAIVNGLPVGATIHEMDEEVDHGPLIARRFVEQYSWDTSLSLYNRVLEAEMQLLEEYFEQIITGSYTTSQPENEGNYFSREDFRKLCCIKPEQQGTFREFYDLLRALSHGSYSNAWFTDPATGKKIYLKLDVSCE